MTTTQYQNNHISAKALAGLMLVQMALGLLLNFYFLKPILRYDGSTSVEEITFILGCATIVALIISAINIAFGLLLPQEKTKEYWRTFVFLIVFAGAGLTLCAYEYAQLAKYVSFLASQSTTEATSQLLRETLASGRNEAHYLSIFVSSCSLALFYFLLIRAELMHKWLSYFAFVATLLQLIAVGHTFFQTSIPNILQLPLLISQLTVPAYLLVLGFKQANPLTTEQPESDI
ncbi:hypothetical protein BIW53_10600 [Pseudoalteromonas byunsanensis]|uniref:DUF4386 domain-containing protein n=2 Tax=Pseudoalteromonas byunsanensis TaxID=327939 RepID=A0A1S1N6X4_9GAMM|nr:hypothetical protein BIW53_10600 [Pseudoalteromonas byunsanensis]